MKTLLKNKWNLTTYLLGFFLFALSLIVSTLLNKGAVKTYFPFTSVILLTIATWFLYKRENKQLKELGLSLNFKNLKFFLFGIILIAFVYLLAKYLRAVYLGETINLSSSINSKEILFAFYTILPTVAVEEFIFRGYLLKKTIELSSAVKANIIFALLFTSIHFFDEDILSHPGKMILIATSIPVGHLLFSTALLKSKTLFFPIGLHLGNNWASRHLISTDSSGNSIFYITDSFQFNTWPGFISFVVLWNLFFLLVILIIWKWDKIAIYLRKNHVIS
ncbi:MAG: hypothetical protein BM563_09985 [Bacteroidetes bacterium MedPE-SWsnd-G1]|nr:MAG: hypothetical protein BM563_09985 [Bacteroidetes bacterium MedPE-SWsnd-G1]